MTLQGWLTFSNVLLFGVAPLATLLGGLGSYRFSNKIKLSPPEVKVKSITPVMIYKIRMVNFKPDKQ